MRLCKHKYELYGNKCPSQFKYHGKMIVGTIFYYRCSKCGKIVTRKANYLLGDWI